MVLSNSKKLPMRSIGGDRKNFAKVFSEALAARLTPNTTLHSDQLAYAIGYEGATVRNWLRGGSQPSGAALCQVLLFFSSQGDHMIWTEIFGEGLVPLIQRKTEADRALELVEAFAEFIGKGAA